MSIVEVLRAAARPLRSRKVRVALATVIASFAAAGGLELREEVVYTILGVGTALILGIAHEDAARHGRPNAPAGETPAPGEPSAGAVADGIGDRPA